MNNNSQDTLRRMNQNDPSLTELRLVGNSYGAAYGAFYSDSSDDYSTLGAAIANNTYLAKLRVTLSDDVPLGVADREFYDGLKRNSSISTLRLHCNVNTPQTIAGVAHEILQVYQENNSYLTFLVITNANLRNGGDRVIVDTLRSCRNLQRVVLNHCNITDEQLLPIVDAIRGHRMLEELSLFGNNIGNVGCEAIAALLADPNCNLRYLSLGYNAFDNEGATTIANSLTTNNKLQKLLLDHNQIDRSVQDVFSNILCNVSNINSVYASNHALKTLSFGGQPIGQQLGSLLRLNEDANKSHVTIKKILRHYPNIDMEPLFQWDADGEQTLKALPYVINCFERARVDVTNDDEEYDIEERKKLSAIFQFVRVMPLLFVPPSHIKADTKKRKRSE